MAPKSKEYSEDFRNLMINRHLNGDSLGDVANYMTIPRAIIQSIIKKYKLYKTVKNFPGGGRKRITTKRIDDLIQRTLISDRRKSSIAM